jgi:hypothetical protein
MTGKHIQHSIRNKRQTKEYSRPESEVISTCDLDMTITVQVQWYKQTRDAPMTDKNTSEEINVHRKCQDILLKKLHSSSTVCKGTNSVYDTTLCSSTRVLCVGSHNYIASSIKKHYTHTVQLQLKHLA